MNRHIIASVSALLLGVSAFAQNWYDAATLPLYGKARQDTKELYERLPAEFEGRSRDAVWYLGRNSAGLYVRFSSNASAIWLRWSAKFGNHMNHQTLTGTRGLDLYVLTDKGEWRFMASGRPTLDSKDCEQKVIGAMEPKWREYMLYLPLYDGLTKLEIGVDREAVVEAPKVDLPRCDKPIVMYNVPGRTGVNMKAETSLRIAREVKGVIGIKEASGDFQQVKQIIEGSEEDFLVLSGDDDMTFELIRAGADGVISVASNVLPREVGRMCGLALNGEFEEAGLLNEKLMPLFKACFVESNPIPGKEALHQLGLCTNAVRLPLSRANENTCKRIKETLAEWK